MPKQTAEQVLGKLYDSWTPHLFKMIQNCRIAYIRHNDRVVFFGGKIAQEGYKSATEARYWYRAMTVEEYAELYDNYNIHQGNSYGGIATNANYVKGYMGNNSTHTHLVEFDTFDINLYNEFTALKPKADMKAEGDGGTFGLGLTGQSHGRCGEIFNDYLKDEKINWKLVYLVVPNPYNNG